jgi:hypothetical protein
MDLRGAETGEGDGTAVAAPGRWLLVLAKKKNNGHACFGLFSLLLPVFFSSLFLLLFSAFFFLFSLFTVANRNSCSPRFICTSLAFFSALFSLFFSSFYALSFCFSFLESWR